MGLGRWKGDWQKFPRLSHQPVRQVYHYHCPIYAEIQELRGSLVSHPDSSSLSEEPAQATHPGEGTYSLWHFLHNWSFPSQDESPPHIQSFPPPTALHSLSLPVSLLV